MAKEEKDQYGKMNATELMGELKAVATAMLSEIEALEKKPTAAGAARVRKATLTIGRIGKEYRKKSVAK